MTARHGHRPILAAAAPASTGFTRIGIAAGQIDGPAEPIAALRCLPGADDTTVAIDHTLDLGSCRRIDIASWRRRGFDAGGIAT